MDWLGREKLHPARARATLILTLLARDLGVFPRRVHAIGMGEALAWSAFWIALALVFNVAVFFIYEHNWMGVGHPGVADLDGWTAALQFLTGYVVEKSLSLDNIFVIALIFAYFGIPLAYQHRVLFWGILGALVLLNVEPDADITLRAGNSVTLGPSFTLEAGGELLVQVDPGICQ